MNNVTSIADFKSKIAQQKEDEILTICCLTCMGTVLKVYTDGQVCCANCQFELEGITAIFDNTLNLTPVA